MRTLTVVPCGVNWARVTMCALGIWRISHQSGLSKGARDASTDAPQGAPGGACAPLPCLNSNNSIGPDLEALT